MKLRIPTLSLVLLVGPSGSGKSTFAKRHFLPTEVLSSDECRAMVIDDPGDQGATDAAFEILHLIAGKRLAAGRLTVIDATNVQPEARRPLAELARAHHVHLVAVVFDLPARLCNERNAARVDRHPSLRVVRSQRAQLRRSLGDLAAEGFDRVFTFESVEDIEAVELEREASQTDRSWDRGPFDVIGDVHGRYEDLEALLARLGYVIASDGGSARHPEDRTAVFLGDLMDDGSGRQRVLRLVMGMCAAGSALCVLGHVEDGLVRVPRDTGALAPPGAVDPKARVDDVTASTVPGFLAAMPSHLVLDQGRLAVAHAGLPAEMHGRDSPAVRRFAVAGLGSGEMDPIDAPGRPMWARRYRGKAVVVYGHTPVGEAVWLNDTIDIDTGCGFGGRLTALRWPERELVSVSPRTGTSP